MKDSAGKIYLIPNIIAPGTQDHVLNSQIIETVMSLDHYLVENIRTARRFISSLKIRDVSKLRFELFDKDSDERLLEKLLEPISQGDSVGVISEAGCPAVADPGNKIVRWAYRNNIKVTPLVGPSSILLALMASGLNGQHFEFHGYLPIDKPLRVKKIKALEDESAKTGKTQIFMETPYRNNAMLGALLDHCRNNTFICIASNLTSPEEFIQTQTVIEWKKNLPDLHKKPSIILLQVPSGHI